jgi:Zn-dependent protease with chaperone function
VNKSTLWLCCILTLTVSACATVPITGRTQLMLIPDDKIIQASDVSFTSFMTVARQKSAVLSESESAEAARVIAMVNRVSNRVIAASGLRDRYNWEVILVKSKARNAFVAPHGKIVVFTGLLPVIQNEAQLAAVIGHEVAHVVARHKAERLSQVLLGELALTAVDIALHNSKNLAAISSVLGLGIQYAVLLPYSREHESEADHISLLYMAKAGYEPTEAIRLWERMSSLEGFSLWDFFSTHPSHDTRRAQIEEWLPEAMVYFTDQSRPLPANLAEVEAAVAARRQDSVLALEGVRPNLVPGFSYRLKLSNRPGPTAYKLRNSTSCATGDCLIVESDLGETTVYTSDFAVVETRKSDGSGFRFDPPLSLAQWPLRVGNSWTQTTTFETAGRKVSARVTGQVVSYESVTVPAGTFMAFKTIISLDGQRYIERWWAPETGTAVRSIMSDGRQGQVRGELLDYQQSADPAGGFSDTPVLANNVQRPQTRTESSTSVTSPANAKNPTNATATGIRDVQQRNSAAPTAVASSLSSGVVSSKEKKPATKTYASLVQYDGPKVKSGITLEAEFVDDGSGNGDGRVIDAGHHVLMGKWTTLAPGKADAPKLIDKKALNALRFPADVPLVTSRFSGNDTVLECLYGETQPLGQVKGECQDNFGNKYHLVLQP